MSSFQMTGYSSDGRLANGLCLLNSGLSFNRAFGNRACPDIGCSLYSIMVFHHGIVNLWTSCECSLYIFSIAFNIN
jgi:hypothetical protein